MDTDVADRTLTIGEDVQVSTMDVGLAEASARWAAAEMVHPKTEEASETVREFLEVWEQDEEAADIAASENLEDFMVSIAKVAAAASVPIPEICESIGGRVGFMWYRPEGHCFLYVNLASMDGEWVRTEKGEHVDSKKLDMKCETGDWADLVLRLRDACGA